MKPLLFFVFLACTLPLPAQIAALLERMEGTWKVAGKSSGQLVRVEPRDEFSVWVRTFSLGPQDDTLETSRGIISCRDHGVILDLQPDSSRGQPRQSFRLLRSAWDEMHWEKESPGADPKRLKWRLYSLRGRAGMNDPDTASRHLAARRSPVKLKFGIQAGLNINTLAPWTGSGGGLAGTLTHYEPKAGHELALFAGIRSAKVPVSLNLEIGLTRRRSATSGYVEREGIRYPRTGTFHSSSFYLALVPEVSFGKKQQFVVSGGSYFDLSSRQTYTSTFNNAAGGRPISITPGQGSGSGRGLIAGFSYSLNSGFLLPLRPSLFTRGMFGLGNSRERAFSVGLRLEIVG